jgi:hypothetical protein
MNKTYLWTPLKDQIVLDDKENVFTHHYAEERKVDYSWKKAQAKKC